MNITVTTLPIIGNDGMDSLVTPWCHHFQLAHPEIQFACTMEGSSTSIMALAANASWVAPISRSPWQYELDAFVKVKGYAPTCIHVGYTGHGPRANAKSPPALYVNQRNPLPGLTMPQVRALYARGNLQGEISLWSQLGLQGEYQHRRIHLYGLCDDGKYATAFRHLHLQNHPYPPHYEPLPDRQAVLEAVANDPFGLGAVGWFNAVDYEKQARIVALAADDSADFVLPDLEQVRQGKYPLSSYVSLYFDLPSGRKLDPLLKEWLAFTLSSEGQAIVSAQTHSAEGYVPLEADQLDIQRQRLAQW
ncbi:PstS family phosphate ABC transporter substrate-binding protein [Erwinia billingiae]|uniref:PstS family phosphate ABC transporter substrate-binding protein n=1 Tax=Erwinia billingiae TaxID=182337 RepID=UPI0022482F23|nr:substrate-binding domain-containing protein [Erwinia billingiae]MCX0498258.1 phosphate-binding protein [Erwinia billingiae]